MELKTKRSSLLGIDAIRAATKDLMPNPLGDGYAAHEYRKTMSNALDPTQPPDKTE